MTARFDVAVIGAGAAGMMCAATAGRRSRRVVLIDHAAKLGEKIRISGGGRCNFTNIRCTPENFLSRNPHFCRSALARYQPKDFIALVEKHGIRYHEKKLGQLFCDRSATQIVDMLKRECDEAGVAWRTPCSVTKIERRGNAFMLDTPSGTVECEALVVATGGLTVPKIGATPFGYKVAEQFGLGVVPPRPALVPLTFDATELARFGDLAGVAADVEVKAGAGRFRESLLFTHRGLSGPAILQISSYWTPGTALHIDLLPDISTEELFAAHRRSRALPATVLGEYLPKRLAQHWCEAADATRPMIEMSDKALHSLAAGLDDWQIKPSGTTGYQKAEVTLGGVDTDALSSKTMEARDVPGLYFIGEVVDVTGHLGGYNFQWAWASGFVAGSAA
jgi:predicted Rossmann fold flavoprotein